MQRKERQMLCSIFALRLVFCAAWWREERKSPALLSEIQMYKQQVVVEMRKARDTAYWSCSSSTALQIILLQNASPQLEKHSGFMIVLGFPYGVGRLEFHVGYSSYQQARPLMLGAAVEFPVVLVKFWICVAV